MIPIKEIHDDVVLDNINDAENGAMGKQMYNRLSKRAENRLFDYLTGDVENIKPPTPYTDQKLNDILSPFIVKEAKQVVNGAIDKPSNYYTFDSLVLLGNYKTTKECDENEDNVDDEIVEGCNTVIELLDSGEFDLRCKTYIEGLQPSFNKPIAKAVGKTFEFMPKDLGSVQLQYVRYPIYGKIVTKHDDVYNEEVIDEALSTPYEYDEFARELIVYFITDTFAIHTRESALKQTNIATGKLVRDSVR